MSPSSEKTLSSEFMDMAREATIREMAANQGQTEIWRFDHRLRARHDQDVAALVEEETTLVERILHYGITSQDHDFRSSSWRLLSYMVEHTDSYVPNVLFFDYVFDGLHRVSDDLQTIRPLWKGECDYTLGHDILRAAAKKDPSVLFFPFDKIEKMANEAKNPIVRRQSQLTFGVFVELRPDLVTEAMVRRQEHTVDYYEDKHVHTWARQPSIKCTRCAPNTSRQSLSGF